MNAEQTFALCTRLIGLALVQQSAELLALGRAYADDGVWSARLLAEDIALFPRFFRGILRVLYAPAGFRTLLWSRLLAAVVLCVAPAGGGVLLPIALATSLVVCLRFRGVFNGGSDYMTIAILLGLTTASRGGLWARAGLIYIAVQALASYTLSGLAKLKSEPWRRGSALPAFLSVRQYGAPALLQRSVAQPACAFLLSWSVIGFECAMPASLLTPHLALVFIAAALAFHLGTVLAFGLNRFLWAWAASYPALYFLAELLQR